MPPGVFGETAKDVGKLQRAAKFCCNAVPGWCPLSENTHREPTHGHRHALTIAIELGEARRPDVGARVHFHTVDNGQKIRTLQAILADGFAQRASDEMLRTPCIKQRNFTAPIAQ